MTIKEVSNKIEYKNPYIVEMGKQFDGIMQEANKLRKLLGMEVEGLSGEEKYKENESRRNTGMGRKE